MRRAEVQVKARPSEAKYEWNEPERDDFEFEQDMTSEVEKKKTKRGMDTHRKSVLTFERFVGQESIEYRILIAKVLGCISGIFRSQFFIRINNSYLIIYPACIQHLFQSLLAFQSLTM